MEKKVSLVCFSCDEPYIAEWIKTQDYGNIEAIGVTEKTDLSALVDYFLSTDSDFLCFLEQGHIIFPNWLRGMMEDIEKSGADIQISERFYINRDGGLKVLAHMDPFLFPKYTESLHRGSELLEESIRNNKNMYGDFSCLLIRTEYAKRVLYDFDPDLFEKQIQKTALLYLLLDGAKVMADVKHITGKLVSAYSDDTDIRRAYCDYLRLLEIDENVVNRIEKNGGINESAIRKRNKAITFIYTDKGEYYNMEPVAEEAKRRGYSVRFTTDIEEKCEIGVYCQHYCLPENADFSVIMLHDMEQGDNRWPDFWRVEQWDRFDLGILPGPVWKDLYARNKFLPYANPRCGAYVLGYPKSDLPSSPEILGRASELSAALQLKYDYSVLYAPSWENDGKEHEAVMALCDLPVNILIKQAHWSDEYEAIKQNISDMRKLHEHQYENVYYIEPEESIMTAIAMCDMVLSDESNVMTEALMFNKPSLAVTDWTIPDTDPPRLSSVPMDYVFKCEKNKIGENVMALKNGEKALLRLTEKRDGIFGNAGSSCSDIMDAIDYFTKNGSRDGFLKKGVESYYAYESLWN